MIITQVHKDKFHLYEKKNNLIFYSQYYLFPLSGTGGKRAQMK